MNVPTFQNGELQSSIYDDVFKYLSNSEHSDYVGDDQTLGWVVTKVYVDRARLSEAVSATGNPRASEARANLRGDYLIRVDSDGMVWAYRYNTMPELMADYAEACEIDNEFAGWTDTPVIDHDENGNVIELDECPHADCGFGECSWLQSGINGACDVHGNNEGRCQR